MREQVVRVANGQSAVSAAFFAERPGPCHGQPNRLFNRVVAYDTGRCARQKTLRLRHSRRTTRQSGFTLIEVIVAFTILGLLALTLFMAFRLSVNSYQKGQERMEKEAQKRVLEDQIKRQLGSLYPLRPAISLANLQQTGMDPAEAMAFAQIPLFHGSTETMTFLTVAPLMLHENPGLTVVRYGLAQDEWGVHYLGAMETRYLGPDSFTFMVNRPEGKPLPLIEPVRELWFEYYGYDSRSQTYDWYPDWNTNELRATPSAVRIHADQKTIVVAINATHTGPATPMGGGAMIP